VISLQKYSLNLSVKFKSSQCMEKSKLGHTQPHIQCVSGAFSPGVKWPGREAYRSPPSSSEVKNACSYISVLLYLFMDWCLNKRGSCLNTGTTSLYLHLQEKEMTD